MYVSQRVLDVTVMTGGSTNVVRSRTFRGRIDSDCYPKKYVLKIPSKIHLQCSVKE